MKSPTRPEKKMRAYTHRHTSSDGMLPVAVLINIWFAVIAVVAAKRFRAAARAAAWDISGGANRRGSRFLFWNMVLLAAFLSLGVVAVLTS